VYGHAVEAALGEELRRGVEDLLSPIGHKPQSSPQVNGR